MAEKTGHTTGSAGGPTVWAGWVILAVALMVIVGVSHMIAGLVALFSEGTFVVGRDGLLVSAGFTTWGWLHIVIGVVVAVAGVGLLVGRTWARVLAVVAAFGSALVNVGFLAAQPATSAVVIGFDVLVIYAVTVHGGELRGVYASTDPDAARYAR
jgi:vacuolar-type H+-ATPase subunit I/STV1